MPRWPGRGGDEGDKGKYADVGRAQPGPKPGTGATESQVRNILARGGQMRPVDIAKQLFHDREGPFVPFAGQPAKTVQNQVSHILAEMRGRGHAASERVSRRESRWSLTDDGLDFNIAHSGPRGAPKPPGWTGGHPRAGEGDPANRRPRSRLEPIKDRPRIEPSRPVSLGEQTRQKEERQARGRGNPANWGRSDMAPESDRNRQVRGRWGRPPDEWNQGDEDEGGKEDKVPWHEKLRPSWEKGKDTGKGGNEGNLLTGDPANYKSGSNDPPPDDNGPKGDGTHWKDYL